MSSPATDVVTPGPARVVEVSEDLYAYIQPDGSWFINNTGFLVGRQGVTSIVAHERCLELSPPFVTYTEGVTVWVDDLRCEFRHVGQPAHTTNDSIAWIPERCGLSFAHQFSRCPMKFANRVR